MADHPFTFEEFEVQEEPRLKVRVQPANFTLYAEYKETASRIYNIKFRPEDVVIMSTPKSGSHWSAEMVWNIVNNVDTETAKKTVFWKRIPMLEADHIDVGAKEKLKMKKEAGETILQIEEVMLHRNCLDDFEKLSSPRICYTHLPFSLLPPNMLEVCKVIYITRNPADVICSYHPFLAARCNLRVDLETFFQMFLDGTVLFTPFWSHVQEAWRIKHHPNMCFLLYEEMKQDLRGCIQKVSKHVQCSLTEEQIDRLEDHLSFENMRNNPAVNGRMAAGTVFLSKEGKLCRKGQIGDFKTTFSEDQKRRIKEWCDANRGDCDVKFPEFDF